MIITITATIVTTNIICIYMLFIISLLLIDRFRSSSPEVFLVKSVLKISSKFTVEYSCRSVITIKLLCNFIEITLQNGCSPVNLLDIFRTLSLRKLLDGCFCKSYFSFTCNLLKSMCFNMS